MVQILKPELKKQILEAALGVFSEKGYDKSTLADISKAAHISSGNIYRYFKDKSSLFYEAVPHELAESIQDIVRKKMMFWDQVTLDDSKGQLHYGREELITLLLAHRREWVILFKHSHGTDYENLTEELAQYFLQLFIKYLASINQKEKGMEQTFQNTVKQIYRGIITSFAELMASDTNHESIRESLNTYMEYHMAGIRQLCR